MAKRSSHSNKKENLPQKETWEDYQHLGSWKMIPFSNASLQRLAHELLEWAKNDQEALVLEKFYLDRGIDTKARKRFKERCPEFKSAHDAAKEMIGVRREMGGLMGKLHENIISKTQPRYSRVWRNVEKWRADLRAKEAKEGAAQMSFKVVQDAIPNSPLVPEKAKSESSQT